MIWWYVVALDIGLLLILFLVIHRRSVTRQLRHSAESLMRSLQDTLVTHSEALQERPTASALTPRSLPAAAVAITFQEDLFERTCFVHVTLPGLSALPSEVESLSFEPELVRFPKETRGATLTVMFDEHRPIWFTVPSRIIQAKLFSDRAVDALGDMLADSVVPQISCERVEPKNPDGASVWVFRVALNALPGQGKSAEALDRASGALTSLIEHCAALKLPRGDDFSQWIELLEIIPASPRGLILFELFRRFEHDEARLQRLCDAMYEGEISDHVALFVLAPERALARLSEPELLAVAIEASGADQFKDPERFVEAFAAHLPVSEAVQAEPLPIAHRGALIKRWLDQQDRRQAVAEAIAALTEREQRALRELLKGVSTLPGALSVSTDSSPQGKLTLKP